MTPIMVEGRVGSQIEGFGQIHNFFFIAKTDNSIVSFGENDSDGRDGIVSQTSAIVQAVTRRFIEIGFDKKTFIECLGFAFDEIEKEQKNVASN